MATEVKLRFLTMSLLVVLAGALVAGCGTSGTGSSSPSGQSTSQKHCGVLRKAGVMLRLGVAYGAFHHWVYKPWQQGAFAKGAPHRTLHIVKAIAAAGLSWHEARKAVSSMLGCGAGQRISNLLSSIRSHMSALKSTTASTPDSTVSSQVSSMQSAWSTIQSAKGGL